MQRIASPIACPTPKFKHGMNLPEIVDMSVNIGASAGSITTPVLDVQSTNMKSSTDTVVVANPEPLNTERLPPAQRAKRVDRACDNCRRKRVCSSFLPSTTPTYNTILPAQMYGRSTSMHELRSLPCHMRLYFEPENPRIQQSA